MTRRVSNHLMSWTEFERLTPWTSVADVEMITTLFSGEFGIGVF